MRKRILITVAAITLLMLGAITVGMGRMHVASAHVQAPVAFTQSNAVQAQGYNQQGDLAQKTQDNGAAVNKTENDPPDPGETPGSPEDQNQNLPGGGHQDQGQVDHQFEGTE